MTSKSRRRWPWIVVAAAVLLLVVTGGFVYAYPSVGAIECPRCFGLVKVKDGLYAESGIDQQSLIDAVSTGEQRVAEFYSGRQATPAVLACRTAGCYRRIGGGGERGKAVRSWGLLLSPRGVDPVIAAHELSHVEFHQRLGSHRKAVPQWFDEGLAVVVSDDSRYLKPATEADRCRVQPDGPLPATLAEWLSSAGEEGEYYAKAACAVTRWLSTHSGKAGVLDLIARVDRGEPANL